MASKIAPNIATTTSAQKTAKKIGTANVILRPQFGQATALLEI
jgi:hypothetical protein